MTDTLSCDYDLSTYDYLLTPIMIRGEKTFMWHSICSRHREYNSECDLCQIGRWHEIRTLLKSENE